MNDKLEKILENIRKDSQTHDHPFEIALVDKLSAKIADDDFAKQLYGALCNCQISALSDKNKYTCSWRYAGGLIADIRNQYFAEHPLNNDPDLCLHCRNSHDEHKKKTFPLAKMQFTQYVCPDQAEEYFFLADHRGREDYMDFYCSGNEGTVSEDVEEALSAIGYQSKPIADNEPLID